jgi:tetratricopeptide (TPR) repeat protein
MIAVVFAIVCTAGAIDAQMPEKPENLQVLPKDIPREALIQRMREFSFALGVRCQYCHAGGDGVSFEGVVFKSDEKPAKQKARAMLKLVDTLNRSLLPAIPARRDPPVQVDCVTCHRGQSVPKTLASDLTDVIRTKGIEAAVQRYRELREKTLLRGLYAFDEWTMNELARKLTEAGNTQAAVAMLELNGEYYPKSADIDFALGQLHETRGERDKAIARYKSVLAKAPDHVRARQRLEALEKQ